MKFDVFGRIENMDLPDGKTAVLYSIYEAVSNSIHAITDRFGIEACAENGRIVVDITQDEAGEIDEIKVTDNGIGFTPENRASFETSDSRYKYTRGGKGVGRLVWIKTFRQIHVQSRFDETGSVREVSFDFVPHEDASITNFAEKSANPGKEPGSRITLNNLRKPLGARINHATVMKDLALHFFSQYISGTLPSVTVRYLGSEQTLDEFIADKVDIPESEDISFEVGGQRWDVAIDHIFVDPTISTELRNSYLLTAHGRLVGEPVSVEKMYDLRSLPEGKAYVAVVRGVPLDDRVDQQRLNFRFNNEQREALEDAVLLAIERRLADHVKTVRNRQKEVIGEVIKEHPQLASQIGNLDDFVQNLYPGMSEEQIATNLFTLLFREERNLRKRLNVISETRVSNDDIINRTAEILKDLGEQEKLRLADLTAKRHQVLVAANLLLKFKEDGEKHEFEKLVHDLICPMGRMYETGNYDEHNLWILDDSLAAYEFFASDKPIASITESGESRKEPDVVFFNPLGFRRPDTTEPACIVEFKRPGPGAISGNPVDQVLEYIENLRNETVVGVDGDVITEITNDTPFVCYVVCELTERTKKILKRGIAHNETPDGSAMYGYSPEHNAMVHVISFRKMIDDAYARNRVYFSALNLPNPSREARSRAARRRAKAERTSELTTDPS